MSRLYDLAVIGGGIQGVGVAQAAIAAGYTVVLFEQQQLASGTSSRSSKLIHGGLRYLESGQFGLVRKAILERKRLLKLAPDLVRLVPFYIPVYPSTQRRAWQIRTGLSIYSALGNFTRETRFKKLRQQAIDKLELKDLSSLQAVYEYYDAQADDAELTRSVMQSALLLGAELLCPARVTALQHQAGRFDIEYSQDDKTQYCQSRVLVNAAGPWVNEVIDRVNPVLPRLEMDLVQGTHLVLGEQAPRGIYYVEAPQDRRAVFVMPWRGKTMVGTTEINFAGNPADVRPSSDELEYLLQVYRHYFAGNDEVVDSFAGLRVLPKTQHSFFHRPRDTVLYQHETNPAMLTLYGGKLTSYRATAQRVMDKLRQHLPEKKPIADTAQLRLEPTTNEFC